MEEIKFRAWNIYKNWPASRMSNPFEMWAKKVTFAGQALMCAKEDMVVMRYLGLKDYYEGDIFKKPGYAYDDDLYILRYGKGEFDSGVYSYMGFYLQRISDGKQAEDTDFIKHIEEYEKVGNIHENPELLKGE